MLPAYKRVQIYERADLLRAVLFAKFVQKAISPLTSGAKLHVIFASDYFAFVN